MARYADNFNLNPAWLISAEQSRSWAQVRDATLTAMTGGPNWLAYMQFLEEKLIEFGAIDVVRNSWAFDRWWTTEEPTNWGLVSTGRIVELPFTARTRARPMRKELQPTSSIVILEIPRHQWKGGSQ